MGKDSLEHGGSMIKIEQWIEPDIEVVLPKTNAYSDNTHNKYSILLKQQIMVIHSCDEEGITQNHRSGKYYGLRLIEDTIEVCIPNFGWLPVYEEIQIIHNDEIAEKELLGEK